MDYLNLYISARKNLNVNNVKKLSQSKIDHIGKMYDDTLFDHYKKQLFFSWINSNENSSASKIQKMKKKLGIELNYFETKKVDQIQPREFAKIRSLKTMEVPYEEVALSFRLSPIAFFTHNNVRFYEMKSIFLKQKNVGKLFISSLDLVLYDEDEKEILEFIYIKEIKSIFFKKYAIILNFSNKSIYLRSANNELVYIYLKRIITEKETLFLDEYNNNRTMEQTIEIFLQIDQNKKK